ncbi:MAG TPA: hypothetical protein VML55_17685, partial [Planctomycetaceae bacterium]|nr:hypothetical protein [Planctomycetaceae bacterium]
YRRRGLAVEVRRAAKQGIDDGLADFLYGHPNERSAGVHAKAGFHPVGRMMRYAKVLRTEPYLRDRLKSGLAASILAKVADPIVRVLQPGKHRRLTTSITVTSPARFDDRFDALFADAAASLRVVGVRDSRYLNWRYSENPLYESHLLTSSDGGRLRGYLVFTIQDGVGQIKDVFPPGDEAAVRDLIQAAIGEGRRRGLASLSFTALEGNPLLPVFSDCAFRRRTGISQMFGYARPDAPWRAAVLDKAAWFLTVGDRDV